MLLSPFLVALEHIQKVVLHGSAGSHGFSVPPYITPTLPIQRSLTMQQHVWIMS